LSEKEREEDRIEQEHFHSKQHLQQQPKPTICFKSYGLTKDQSENKKRKEKFMGYRKQEIANKKNVFLISLNLTGCNFFEDMK
jgi:hypothetical protein